MRWCVNSALDLLLLPGLREAGVESEPGGVRLERCQVDLVARDVVCGRGQLPGTPVGVVDPPDRQPTGTDSDGVGRGLQDERGRQGRRSESPSRELGDVSLLLIIRRRAADESEDGRSRQDSREHAANQRCSHAKYYSK